ncbi:tRNA (guanosine(46)-N7)-methyltransferase TrmB [Desulforegula conservatrix]|uniref:tRNA (guanosine(46)-N7)-methyltransferase TrmB n=1 Tax=Desulforegula conservatrix TaxID=153026 RepID=UPI0004820DD2|nr:tRNA (guanosine(46)-N7)-methyltransferase TrmB [Desulforegula conservatrix]
MGRKKAHRYDDVYNFPNVIKIFPGDDSISENMERLKQKISDFEDNIIIELGCGKGEYTLGLARRYPERFIIGIDIKSDRIWRGATNAIQEGLYNAFFARIRIESILDFFHENTVDEIWIPFPDPQSGESKANIKKRLTSEKFLEIYRKILKPGGSVHLKTDDDNLYHFSKESALNSGASLIYHTDDLYNNNFYNISDSCIEIQTTFEKKYLKKEKKIKYINFTFSDLSGNS